MRTRRSAERGRVALEALGAGRSAARTAQDARPRRCNCAAAGPASASSSAKGSSSPGLTEPFDFEVWIGDRVAVLGPNGTGKSHFLRLLAGGAVDHAGAWKLGAEVRPALFHQTNEPEAFNDRTPLEVLDRFGPRPMLLAGLARYGIRQCADLPVDVLSGGQRARLQILGLELEHSNLLLLDEPTDNLDLDSAEALQGALEEFDGTLLTVTHDRWFMKTADRFIVFANDCSVTEVADLDAALAILESG